MIWTVLGGFRRLLQLKVLILVFLAIAAIWIGGKLGLGCSCHMPWTVDRSPEAQQERFGDLLDRLLIDQDGRVVGLTP